MTRYIGADVNIEDYLPKAEGQTYFENFEYNYGHDNIEEIYQRAVDRLETMFWFGLQEEHKESLYRLFDKIGLEDKSSIEQKEVAPKARDIDKETIRKIEDLTVYDRKLYTKARELFYDGQS